MIIEQCRIGVVGGAEDVVAPDPGASVGPKGHSTSYEETSTKNVYSAAVCFRLWKAGSIYAKRVYIIKSNAALGRRVVGRRPHRRISQKVDIRMVDCVGRSSSTWSEVLKGPFSKVSLT